MKATELRLGNLFANIEDNSIYKVTKINEDTIEGICINNMGWIGEQHFHLIEQVLPIKLTEEWLLKFGFEDVTGVDYILHIDVDFKLILIPADAFYPQIDKADDIGWSSISLNKIEYIHQLQNLYFALTGEELTQVSEGKNKNFV